jgi:hypothetical protein
LNRPGPLLAAAAALLLTAACGGGSGSGGRAELALVYQDPTGPAAWRIQAEAPGFPSTSHLVLDLMAPDGASGQGVTLILTTDQNAQWSKVDGSHYEVQTTYPSPLVEVASVQDSSLRILVAQAPGAPVAYGAKPLLQVALDLAAGASAGSVTLSATAAGHLGASAPAVPITVEVGTLQAR